MNTLQISFYNLALFHNQVEELKSIPAKSKSVIDEMTTRNNSLEKEREKEEKKLKEVMDSLKQETQGLQKEKEVRVHQCWLADFFLT